MLGSEGGVGDRQDTAGDRLPHYHENMRKLRAISPLLAAARMCQSRGSSSSASEPPVVMRACCCST